MLSASVQAGALPFWADFGEAFPSGSAPEACFYVLEVTSEFARDGDPRFGQVRFLSRVDSSA